MNTSTGNSRRLKGQGASPGVAIGPVFDLRVERADVADRLLHQDENDAGTLANAIGVAIEQLVLLSDSITDEDASTMIAFQIAMLEDDELSQPAFDSIQRGDAAASAWSAALDEQIDDYRQSSDEYFAARATDIADIRDRVLRSLRGDDAQAAPRSVPPKAVVLAQDLSPSQFLETDWSESAGIVLEQGSHLGHVAILARSQSVPFVVGVTGLYCHDSDVIALDGETGEVFINPDGATVAALTKRQDAARATQSAHNAYLARPAVTQDGHAVAVQLNVATLDELQTVDPAHCDGIGLMRSEFLFSADKAFPDEDQQTSVYMNFVKWAGGRPVTIRTLDAGGDKPIAGITRTQESNPFLGLRGIRLSLANPELLLVQCRALARAAATGPVRVMFPMVTCPEEFDEAVTLFEQAIAELERSDIPCARPKLGMMLEVPAAIYSVGRFTRAEFFSVGSNDLLHYMSATARDDASLLSIASACEPVMLQMIQQACRDVENTRQSISLCGDIAGDSAKIHSVLHTGIRCVSVSTAKLAATKAAICSSDISGGLI